MKHLETHARTTPVHDETNEDVERPLRLDRQALRLDPPVVRFAEDRAAEVPTR
jgi:hypothetical protein